MTRFVHYLKREIKKHLFDYLLLVTAGVFFLIGINYFRGERLIEFIITIAFTSFYIIWGIYHHFIENDLHMKIMLEYILIGFTILFFLKFIILP